MCHPEPACSDRQGVVFIAIKMASRRAAFLTPHHDTPLIFRRALPTTPTYYVLLKTSTIPIFSRNSHYRPRNRIASTIRLIPTTKAASRMEISFVWLIFQTSPKAPTIIGFNFC